jgi:hypothetical protein
MPWLDKDNDDEDFDEMYQTVFARFLGTSQPEFAGHVGPLINQIVYFWSNPAPPMPQLAKRSRNCKLKWVRPLHKIRSGNENESALQ